MTLKNNGRCRLLKALGISSLLVFTIGSSSCAYDMSRQPKYKPMSYSDFFPDYRSERPVVDGTIALNPLYGNNSYFSAHLAEIARSGIPIPITLDLLKRGQEKFNINCSPCHDRIGNGEGIIVQRGFPHPPSYHTERLRQAPDGHFFAVITEGLGRMWSYANRVDAGDRWAVAAYIRALQLSQNAAITDVPQSKLNQLLEKKP
jgi:hypothetical protein